MIWVFDAAGMIPTISPQLALIVVWFVANIQRKAKTPVFPVIVFEEILTLILVKHSADAHLGEISQIPRRNTGERQI